MCTFQKQIERVYTIGRFNSVCREVKSFSEMTNTKHYLVTWVHTWHRRHSAEVGKQSLESIRFNFLLRRKFTKKTKKQKQNSIVQVKLHSDVRRWKTFLLQTKFWHIEVCDLKDTNSFSNKLRQHQSLSELTGLLSRGEDCGAAELSSRPSTSTPWSSWQARCRRLAKPQREQQQQEPPHFPHRLSLINQTSSILTHRV